jgi:indolepyruvate ferredoxin oxidoreductase alpha subunit
MEFVKDPSRFVTVPAVARERHLALLEKLKEAEGLAEISKFNKMRRIGKSEKRGIITSSAGANYAMDSVHSLGIEVDVLKLGFSHPLPSKLVGDFLKSHEVVLVVEELEPILENAVRALAQRQSLKTMIIGKSDGALPRAHEFDQNIVEAAIQKAFGIKGEATNVPMIPGGLPGRPPVLCAGCPHGATYFAVNKAVGKKAIFASDIGCYTLGVAPPYRTADLLICMGSSVGTAGGLAMVNDVPVIAFIGDSTFFHAGIPGLINAVHHGHKFLLMILDNRTTAMTGHQPHPGSAVGPSCCDITAVSIEDIVKGCGVKWLRIVDPYDVKTTTETVKEGVAQEGVSVIIARRECILLARRDRTGAGARKPHIDQTTCTRCRTCVDKFQCPAISSIDKVQNIDETLCAGCGVCTQVCPSRAIKEGK